MAFCKHSDDKNIIYIASFGIYENNKTTRDGKNVSA